MSLLPPVGRARGLLKALDRIRVMEGGVRPPTPPQEAWVEEE